MQHNTRANRYFIHVCCEFKSKNTINCRAKSTINQKHRLCIGLRVQFMSVARLWENCRSVILWYFLIKLKVLTAWSCQGNNLEIWDLSKCTTNIWWSQRVYQNWLNLGLWYLLNASLNNYCPTRIFLFMRFE